MTPDDFKRRTKAFALRCIRLTETLPKSPVGHVIAGQLLRCATSVGANYRSACRARSRRDFIAKLRIVEEECDEALYWMELLLDSGQVKPAMLRDLMEEADAVLALVVASIKTARARAVSAHCHRERSLPNPQSSIVNPQSSIANRQSAMLKR